MAGGHAGFILAAYAVTVLVILGLVLRAILDQRQQGRALAALEARGVRRRSAPRPSEASPQTRGPAREAAGQSRGVVS